MAVDASGEWWVGSQPEDIAEFLIGYASKGYEVTDFRLAKCGCGSLSFRLFADDNEGTAKRICTSCAAEHFVCDSGEYWAEAEPEECICSCGCSSQNVGVGFSVYEDREAVKWLYVGVRCIRCGILGCFAGWKIAYSPSMQLMDQV